MEQKQLYEYFQGQATDTEADAIRTWVENSEENRLRFISERRRFDMVVVSRSKEELQQMLSRRRSFPAMLRRGTSMALRYAAVVAVVFFVRWLIMQRHDEERYQALMQTISVPAGQRVNIDLPDGTNVWLNAGTTLRYPICFNRRMRSVELDGQAYFEVAHNPHKPFIVNTSQWSVKVLGTKFDVMDYSSSDLFETALMEGSVQVTMTNDPSQQMVLTSGSRAMLRNGKLVCLPLADQSVYCWRDGLIGFTNAPLSDILTQFERTYAIRIKVENQIMQHALYTGKFRVTDGVDYALRVLQKNVQFRFERDTISNVIYIR